MTFKLPETNLPFTAKKKARHVAVHLIAENKLGGLVKDLPKAQKLQIKDAGFEAKPESTCVLRDENGAVSAILCGVHSPLHYYDAAYAYDAAVKSFGKDTLKDVTFEIENADDAAVIGWGLGAYNFEKFKEEQSAQAMLVVPAKSKAAEHLKAIYLCRSLINLPANHLGPAQLEDAVRLAAKPFKAKVSSVKDKELLKQNFPLIYTVGEAAASDRRPRLIELNWGNEKDQKLTLVGKGVCFDTGGLDLKPSQYMRLMKKDMGGAAHALGLAMLIMAAGLKVRLKLLIPAVENSVGGAAFRPGDVITARNGITVENTNTDAEGRLVLADALAYASEEKPDLIVDFATLTGSARAALGPDIPACFARDEKMHKDLRELSLKAQDPLWPMPLHQDYRKHIKSDTGEIVNSAGLPGDLIYSALFLESFVGEGLDWVHLDCFAWEQTGRPGRPKGGADTGLRAMFDVIQKRYGKAPNS